MNQRIKWVDYLKGIAILLVIVAHTIRNEYIQTFLNSFLMPLFFMLSGYVSRIPLSSDGKKAKSAKASALFKRLIIPAYVIWIIRIFAYHFVRGDRYSFYQYILSAVYASGSKTVIGGIEVPAFGIMWFLVTLFLSRVICDYVWIWINSETTRHIFFCISCIIGIISPVYLPFSFDVVLVAVVFYHIGRTLKDKGINNYSKRFTICSGIVWGGVLLILFFTHKRFELATRSYPYYILSIAMASFASCFICNIAYHCKVLPFERMIAGIGYHSMTLFVIHAFDAVWYPYLQKLGNKGIVLFARLCIDLFLLLVIIIVENKIKRTGEK